MLDYLSVNEKGKFVILYHESHVAIIKEHKILFMIQHYTVYRKARIYEYIHVRRGNIVT